MLLKLIKLHTQISSWIQCGALEFGYCGMTHMRGWEMWASNFDRQVRSEAKHYLQVGVQQVCVCVCVCVRERERERMHITEQEDFSTDSVRVHLCVCVCVCVWYAPHTQHFTQIPRHRNHKKEGRLSSNSCTIWESHISTRREEEEEEAEEGNVKEVARIPEIPVPQKQDMCTGPLTLNDDGEKRSLKPGWEREGVMNTCY